MEKINPLVSIIIPAYNAQKYIKRAIESAFNQTYKNIEVIVVDDGSTDKTAEIVESFKDWRIRYFYQKNQGQGVAKNYGIKESKGKYITFLDADDFYFPEKVQKEVEFLESQTEFKIVYCNTLHFYSKKPDCLFKKKGEYPSGDIFPALLHSSLINPNTVMIAREVLQKVGGFSETRYYPEEWDLWLRIARVGYRFGYFDADLVKVEIREESNTTMEIQPILKKYTLEMFKKLFSEMTLTEREKYEVDKILKNLRWKLAVAYLANSRKKEFTTNLSGLGIKMKIIGNLISLLPSWFTKVVVRKIWRLRQSLSLKEIGPL